MVNLIVALALIGGTPDKVVPVQKVIPPKVQSTPKADLAPHLQSEGIEPSKVEKKKIMEEMLRLKKILKEAEKNKDFKRANEARIALDKMLHPQKYVKKVEIKRRTPPTLKTNRIAPKSMKGDLK